ncbi:hypothetical protein CEP54_010277 [Fusarium duplospermum]|uniref:Uncharacterized protein n=1 Tax=Fusarium duplospermum TaxID=1325734 RepID=A0A428PKS5_9HYPO|nr:hypothetical protein CEP54_010277 [Fusarium duplospermum]
MEHTADTAQAPDVLRPRLQLHRRSNVAVVEAMPAENKLQLGTDPNAILSLSTALDPRHGTAVHRGPRKDGERLRVASEGRERMSSSD